MTTQEKKDKIRALVAQMLADSQAHILKDIDKALDCGAIDIDEWDENCAPMIVPKSMLCHLMRRESDQYDLKGTSYEKEAKSIRKNLSCFV